MPMSAAVLHYFHHLQLLLTPWFFFICLSVCLSLYLCVITDNFALFYSNHSLSVRTSVCLSLSLCFSIIVPQNYSIWHSTADDTGCRSNEKVYNGLSFNNLTSQHVEAVVISLGGCCWWVDTNGLYCLFPTPNKTYKNTNLNRAVGSFFLLKYVEYISNKYSTILGIGMVHRVRQLLLGLSYSTMIR